MVVYWVAYLVVMMVHLNPDSSKYINNKLTLGKAAASYI
jgi:hypothetical protein